MNKVFNWLGSIIERYPFKVLLISILLFSMLIFGATKIEMATGNETLVQDDNPVYISNQKMENTFGGESILVLFTDKTEGNLLSVENIRRMWNVEKRFQYDENIFSFMSPASIVHQMTETQGTKIKEQVLTLSDGLEEMGTKMKDIGSELSAKELMDTAEIENKLENLSSSTDAFNKLINGQKNMANGAKELQGGLYSIASGLEEVSGQLTQLSNMVGENQELKIKLSTISGNIYKSSQGISTMAEKTSNIKTGADNTANALNNVSNKLSNETSSMKDTFANSNSIRPDEMKEMANGFITMGDNLLNISEGLSTFYAKSEMMVADIPSDQVELDNILYDEDSNLRSVFSNVVLDDKNSLMVVKLQGNLDDEYKKQVSENIAAALEREEFETLSYVVSGKPVLDTALKNEMKTNMVIMVGLAVVIMLIVLFIVFKVKWRMLSLGIILVSVIATLGLMGHITVPVTMVSMAVFPILIGLGIDYSIQFHNRYEEEKSVKTTLRNIGTAVAIAVLATVLGFVSLYASPVPMIQDFGKMLTIGVIISFIGSIFLLTPILHLRDLFGLQNKDNVKLDVKEVEEKDTFLNKILKGSTKTVVKFSVPVLLIAIIAAGFGFYLDNKVGVQTDIESFMPQDMNALQDIHTVRDAVGSTDQMAIYISDDNILEKNNINWIQQITRHIQEKYTDVVVDIKSIDTLVSNLGEDISADEYAEFIDDLPGQQVNMFLNSEQNESVILLNIEHLDTERLQDFVSELKADLKDAPMNVEVTGKSVLDVEMVNGLTSGRVLMTIIGLVLVFVALLIVYRNFIKALVPIIPVILIVGMSSGIMYLLGVDYTPITTTLGALVLGMGTEMTVMLMERYIEERKIGKDKSDAIIHSTIMIGKAIVASGLTTVGGFSVLMLSEFVILKDFGLMTVINISLALLSTFIILPPILSICDRFLLSKKEKEEAENASIEIIHEI